MLLEWQAPFQERLVQIAQCQYLNMFLALVIMLPLTNYPKSAKHNWSRPEAIYVFNKGSFHLSPVALSLA